MTKLIRNEPVMVFAVTISLVLAALIVLGKLTLEDVQGFVAIFFAVLAVVVPTLAGLAVRARVTPTKTEG